MSDFSIRPMRADDEPFVYRAWLRGYWEHFPGRVIVSESEFMERWHRVIERILADKRTRTVVAHVEGQPDTLLGFACGNDACLHWCYVKQAFRRLGICRALLDAWNDDAGVDTFDVSHWSHKVGDDFWHYAPHLLKEYGE